MIHRFFTALVFILCAVLFFPGGLATAQDGFLTHSETQDVEDGSFGCFAGDLVHADNSYYRTFTICDEPFEVGDEIEITSIEFACNALPAAGFDTQPVVIRIWEDLTGEAPELDDLDDDPDDGTLLGEEEFEIELALAEIVTVEFTEPVGIPCDTTFVVEIFTPASGIVAPTFAFPFNQHRFGMGHNEDDETSLSYLLAASCGISEISEVDPISASVGGGDVHYVINVNYEETGDCICTQGDCQSPLSRGQRYTFRNTVEEILSEPALEFSDTDAAEDTITIDGEDIPVDDVDVLVNITHAFIGDVQVSLTAPSETEVVLHGGPTDPGLNLDDIHTIYDDEGRENAAPYNDFQRMMAIGPGDMGEFTTSDRAGDWVLTVEDDTAGIDGVLDDWTLMFQEPLDIPDDDADGVESSVVVPDLVIDDVRDIDVELHLSHPGPADLVMELESPAGTTVTFVDGSLSADETEFTVRIGDSAEDAGDCDTEEIHDIDATPGSLADFDGEPAAGEWTLTVVDDSALDEGAILDWTLMVAPARCDDLDDVVATSDCALDAVNVSWLIPEDVEYTEVEIWRDGEFLIAEDPEALLYTDEAPGAGVHTYRLIADCDPGRSETVITVEHVPCCEVTGAAATTDCDLNSVFLAWGIETDAVYDAINVFRDDELIGEDLDGETVEFFDEDVEAGLHTYVIEATCPDDRGTSEVVIEILHAPFDGQTDLVWGPSSDGFLGTTGPGAIDSAAFIMDSLVTNDVDALRIPSLDYDCMPDASEFERVWVACGTFPFNHTLTDEEGTILAEFATGDVDLDGTVDNDPIAIYLEGGDIWGIDPATPFADYDGCEHGVDDGDNSFMGMNGEAHGDLDLTDYEDVDYTQEEDIIIEFIDNMIPTGTTGGVDEDLGGDDAGTIWENDGRELGSGFYTTGVFYQALYPVGEDIVANRIITCAFEFGGFEGDQDELMGLYLDAMEPPEPPLADFEYTPDSGSAPLDVEFTDLSTGDPTEWEWDFGDGNTSDEQNPAHTYEEGGTYDVTLTVSNSGGADSITLKEAVTVSDGAVFLRGDANSSGDVSGLPDGLFILRFQFTPGSDPILCEDAADANDSGEVEAIPDALFLFRWQFGGDEVLVDPGPDECGPDPDEGLDVAGCETPPPCPSDP